MKSQTPVPSSLEVAIAMSQGYSITQSQLREAVGLYSTQYHETFNDPVNSFYPAETRERLAISSASRKVQMFYNELTRPAENKSQYELEIKGDSEC